MCPRTSKEALGLSGVRSDARWAAARGQATSRVGRGVRGGTFCTCPVPEFPGTCGPAPSWGTVSVRQLLHVPEPWPSARGHSTCAIAGCPQPTASPNPPTAAVVNSRQNQTQQKGQPWQRRHTSKGPVWGAAPGSWGAEQSRARVEGRNQRSLTPEPSSGPQPQI